MSKLEAHQQKATGSGSGLNQLVLTVALKPYTCRLRRTLHCHIVIYLTYAPPQFFFYQLSYFDKMTPPPRRDDIIYVQPLVHTFKIQSKYFFSHFSGVLGPIIKN